MNDMNATTTNANEPIHVSQRTVAVVAGAAILAMAILAGFAYGFVVNSLFVPSNASATVQNVRASEMLLRLGIMSFLLIIICDVLVAWSLYYVLEHVNKRLSVLAAWFRLVFAAMFGAALWNFVAVLRVIRGADSAMPGTAGGLNAQVLLFFHSFNDIWSLGLVLFGLHLFLVGYLVFRSGRMPRVLGVLAMIAAVCYLATSTANLVLPNYDQYKPTVELFLTAPMAIGELSVGLWLLIKGGKE